MAHVPYWDVLNETARRVGDAATAQAGLRSNSARAALRAMLGGAPGAPDALLGAPVFEPASVWRSEGDTIGGLEGNLLDPALVKALDAARGDARVPRDRLLYTHQIAAWRAALEGERRSFAVTSGTGSGKTECFMIPILHDLIAAPTRPGGAVRAIMLYPLNALIESQRRRLGAWLEGFGGKLRYGLYKGDMPEKAPAATRPPAWETADRQSLRARPPDILVTNITMLEFMMVRPQDQQILARSQGALRWIVIDEAHSYAGAQAAEIAMLLRRVRAAFGVRPEDVRILATSATLGEGADGDLRRFIADLADAPEESVTVIHGSRDFAVLPDTDADAATPNLALPDDASAFNRLGAWPPMHTAITRLRTQERLSLRDADRLLLGDGTAPSLARSMALMEAAGAARDTHGAQLAPWRLHAFLRAQPGLWSCSDPACPEAVTQMGADRDWPFGALYVEQRARCGCGAPVYEIETCSACATPRLRVQSTNGEPRRIIQPVEANDDDEYALDIDDDEQTESEGAPVGAALLPPRPDDPLRLDAETAALYDSAVPPGMRGVRVRYAEIGRDALCCAESRRPPRRARFGAPFLLGAAITPLLRAAPDHEKASHPADRPAFGRRLLSFTDSRQGTARFAAKLQQEAERALVRAAIWHAVSETPPEPADAAQKRVQIETLRLHAHIDPGIAAIVAGMEKALQTAPAPVRWADMAARLAENSEMRNWAVRTWRSKRREDGWFGEDPHRLAEMLLFRETLRRPKYLNNVETLGIAALRFADLEAVAPPQAVLDAGRTREDWIDFLRLCVDFGFRQNLAVRIEQRVMLWASPDAFRGLPFVAPLGSAKPTGALGKALPMASSGDRARLVRYARRMLALGTDDLAARDRIDDLLRAAWTAFRQSRTIMERSPDEWVLDYAMLSFAPAAAGWRCPVTLRAMSYAPLGLTPFGDLAATQFSLPRLPVARSGGLGEDDRAAVRRWLAEDAGVAAARRAGAWSDLHDRAAAFEPFHRAAEHSAQLSRADLARYETEFEDGALNILSCSTTMEMGVDIAGVGVVVNANVPPSPANYRQRIGRAGRRGEPRSLAFTFCKDRPHDWAAFHDPEGALLAAPMAAPRIRLDSAVIVARHVNAFFLAVFLREHPLPASALRLPAGAFFGGPADIGRPFEEASAAEAFSRQLRRRDGFAEAVVEAAQALTRGTPLDGAHDLPDRVAEAFSAVFHRWRAQWEGIVNAARGFAEDDPARKALGWRLKRHCSEFLLIELARRGFTPAYGFPINVVSFDAPLLRVSGGDMNNERFDQNAAPSRSIEVAIRDYAPGADVVVDGLVYASSGVALAWSQAHQPGDVEDLRRAWWCTACAAFGVDATQPSVCPDCGAPITNGFEVLRPAGFASDAAPHARYETARFIKPADPWVTARGGAPRALPDPSVGAMRTARAGAIFHHTGAPGGEGYAICIACGRAEPETAKADAPLPAAMRDHAPLGSRRTGRSEICRGATEPFMIRRHARLGAETTTDVFELTLTSLPANELGKRIGLTLGSALREALARRIGVDAQEMGVLARGHGDGDGGVCVRVLLYDRAAGGAGFSPLAAEETPSLLKAAEAILNCPTGPACVTACPRCVLARDLQYDVAALDRHATRAFLHDEVLPKLEAPPSLRAFGSDTRIETRALAETIDAEMARRASLRVDLYLHGDPRAWDLGAWSVRPLLRRRHDGAVVRLIAEPAALLALSTGQKLALDRMLAETGAHLAQAACLPCADDGRPVIADIAEATSVRRYAAGAAASAAIGPEWGAIDAAPLPYARGRAPIDCVAVAPDAFLRIGLENALRVEIGPELDGPIKDFGRRFWECLQKRKPQILAHAHAGAITRITYIDRYLVSPITVRLLREVIGAAPGRGQIAAVVVESAPPVRPEADASAVWSNWPRAETRDAVLQAMLKNHAQRVSVTTMARRDMPHERSLEVLWENGEKLVATLDQGFGAWRAAGRPRHDFVADAVAQAGALTQLGFDIRLDGAGTAIILQMAG